jgi:hypothetical protein
MSTRHATPGDKTGRGMELVSLSPLKRLTYPANPTE